MLWMKDDRLTRAYTIGNEPGKDQEDDRTKGEWTVLKRIYDEPV